MLKFKNVQFKVIIEYLELTHFSIHKLDRNERYYVFFVLQLKHL